MQCCTDAAADARRKRQGKTRFWAFRFCRSVLHDSSLARREEMTIFFSSSYPRNIVNRYYVWSLIQGWSMNSCDGHNKGGSPKKSTKEEGAKGVVGGICFLQGYPRCLSHPPKGAIQNSPTHDLFLLLAQYSRGRVGGAEWECSDISSRE